MNSRQVVIDAIRFVFPRFQGEITGAISAADVAGWDSFSHVQLMFEIESRLGRAIDIATTYDLTNVEELVAFLERQS